MVLRYRVGALGFQTLTGYPTSPGPRVQLEAWVVAFKVFIVWRVGAQRLRNLLFWALG